MEKHLQINYISKNDSKIKGQKIVAAIYIVTNHLSDNDPFKIVLRKKALELLDTSSNTQVVIAEDIATILGSAVLARAINENNASTIIREVKLFAGNDQDMIAGLLDYPLPISRTNNMSIMSNTMSFKTKNVYKNKGDKTNRQEKILAHINDKKSAAIKDIASLFPDVSEKTIQRELGSLVDSGKIRKHGSKRWSLYLALNQ